MAFAATVSRLRKHQRELYTQETDVRYAPKAAVQMLLFTVLEMAAYDPKQPFEYDRHAE